jgi:general secretion pathway protein D
MHSHKTFLQSGAALCALLALLLSFPAAAAPAGAPAQQTIRMNFQDADIRHIIKFIQDVTGDTILVDSNVKGTITIASDTLLPLDQALEVLNSALRAKGFTMVRSENIIRIIPLEQSKQTNVPTRIGEGFSDIPENESIITQVIPIKQVDAAKVRADLKALVSEHGEIVNNEESNSIIITDTSANVKRLMEIIDFLDRESPRRMQIKVFTLDYAKATDMANLISKLPRSSGGAGETDAAGQTPAAPASNPSGSGLEITGELTVLADERSNSLVVATYPSNFPAIESLVKSLDGMLSQVLIEVLIIEASLDSDTKMGMEWTMLKQRTVSGDSVTGAASTDWNLASEQFGLKGQILKDGGASQLLGYLIENQERINILSTPMIVTTDNTEAQITVGSEVPYLKETRRSTGDTKDFVYEYRDVGIKLTVTPHINDQRFVNMDIHQEIKKLGAQTLFDAFIIIQREADASVVVKDGQTIVLGGLMRDDETITRNSVPFLGDLPLVGKLFRTKRTVGEKTELLVFITPYVVANQQEIDDLTIKHQERMNKLLQENEKMNKTMQQDIKEAGEEKQSGQ